MNLRSESVPQSGRKFAAAFAAGLMLTSVTACSKAQPTETCAVFSVRDTGESTLRPAIVSGAIEFGGVPKKSIDDGKFTGVGNMVETRGKALAGRAGQLLLPSDVIGVKVSWDGTPGPKTSGTFSWGPGSKAIDNIADVSHYAGPVDCSTGLPLK